MENNPVPQHVREALKFLQGLSESEIDKFILESYLPNDNVKPELNNENPNTQTESNN
jgi:hypothetical protein